MKVISALASGLSLLSGLSPIFNYSYGPGKIIGDPTLRLARGPRDL